MIAGRSSDRFNPLELGSDILRGIKSFIMPSTVASGGSPPTSSVSIQEKGSKNKRKFRADSPLADLSNHSLSDNKYESCSMEKPSTNAALEKHLVGCDVCRTFTYAPIGTDWSDIETQLEELVLSNLDMIFKSAIKRITSFGYTEEVAASAILWSGHFYGCKDTVSNIVDNVLAFLGSGEKVDSFLRASSYEELRKFEKGVLEDMVCVVREVRPFFSVGEAMWFLLICDMNLSHACAMVCDPLQSMGSNEFSGGSYAPQLKFESYSDSSKHPARIPPNVPRSKKLNKPPLPYPKSQSGKPAVVGIPNLPSRRFTASRNLNVKIPNSNPVSSSGYVVGQSYSQTMSPSSLPEEKLRGSRKGHAGDFKRDYMVQKKTIHLESGHQGQRCKAIVTTHKVSSLSGWMLDKKGKPISDPTNIMMRNLSLKPNKTVETNTAEADPICTVSSKAGPSDGSSSNTRTCCCTSTSAMENTESSLPLVSDSTTGVSSKPNSCVETRNCSSYTGILSDKIWGQLLPENKKNEMLIKLVPCVQELQFQLQDWTEWAQQKVMQAAYRLNKDKAELQALRQEKVGDSCFQKENQTLEENAKLKEMENAFSKASDHVENANATVHRLEIENSVLKQQMQAAKLFASESAVRCNEVLLREMDTLKKLQSSERQKPLLHEELATEKHKLSQLQQKLEQAKEYHNQLEARRRKEEKLKEEALAQAEHERKGRERIEALAKSKEEAMRSKAESEMERYKAESRRLEHEIAKLILTTTMASTPRWWGPEVEGSGGDGDMQRDRECVMCLAEETSVVFLPCAHQVVCDKCSEMHERQGIKDCPSCRTPIHRRIHVRSALS